MFKLLGVSIDLKKAFKIESLNIIRFPAEIKSLLSTMLGSRAKFFKKTGRSQMKKDDASAETQSDLEKFTKDISKKFLEHCSKKLVGKNETKKQLELKMILAMRKQPIDKEKLIPLLKNYPDLDNTTLDKIESAQLQKTKLLIPSLLYNIEYHEFVSFLNESKPDIKNMIVKILNDRTISRSVRPGLLKQNTFDRLLKKVIKEGSTERSTVLTGNNTYKTEEHVTDPIHFFQRADINGIFKPSLFSLLMNIANQSPLDPLDLFAIKAFQENVEKVMIASECIEKINGLPAQDENTNQQEIPELLGDLNIFITPESHNNISKHKQTILAQLEKLKDGESLTGDIVIGMPDVVVAHNSVSQKTKSIEQSTAEEVVKAANSQSTPNNVQTCLSTIQKLDRSSKFTFCEKLLTQLKSVFGDQVNIIANKKSKNSLLRRKEHIIRMLESINQGRTDPNAFKNVFSKKTMSNFDKFKQKAESALESKRTGLSP